MTDTTTLPADDQPEIELGAVGRRRLVAVQTIDIGRLLSDPVWLAADSLNIVTGRGPTDSNQSGKTTFEAAVTLLLADPSWPAGAGMADAKGLLFDPVKAGVDAKKYAAPSAGYVIGIFHDPADGPYSVWVRIGRGAPYIRVRHDDGVHLARGEDHRARIRHASEVWESLPSSSEVGARSYPRTIYGPAPRCVGHVTQRGDAQGGTSLLRMSAKEFTPDRLGRSLVDLTGRQQAFEEEKALRKTLAAQEASLAEMVASDATAQRDESIQLEVVKYRDDIRALLDECRAAWRVRAASAVVAAADRYAGLDEDVQAAERRVAHATDDVAAARSHFDSLDDISGLEAAARKAAEVHGDAEERWTDALTAKEQARQRLQSAEVELQRLIEAARDADDVVPSPAEAGAAVDDARVAVAEAKAAHKAAVAREAAASRGAGPAGKVIDRLAAVGIDATGLLDSVLIDDAARDRWEPVLFRYADAAIVAPADLDAAAAEAPPGTILIPADTDTVLPDGIVDGGPAAGWLARLAERTGPHPAGAVDGSAVHIGGFPKPISGRQALIDAATVEVADTRDQLDAAEHALSQALTVNKRAHAKAAAEEAAAKIPAARETLATATTAATEAAKAAEAAQEVLSDAQHDLSRAQAELAGRDELHQSAKERLADKEAELARQQAILADRVETRDSIPLARWFGPAGVTDADEARAMLEASEVVDRNPSLLVAHATAPLANVAKQLEWLGEMRLKEAAEHAENRLTADGSDLYVGYGLALDDLLAPIQRMVDEYADDDADLAVKIEAARRQRATEIETANDEIARITRHLTDEQAALADRIRHTFTLMSDAFTRIDAERGGYGATIDFTVHPPASSSDEWRFEATPKWVRNPGGQLLGFATQANEGQMKRKTVSLVLSALLASPGSAGRVMVLDELGDSLGTTNFAEVVDEIAQVCREEHITVIGTFQDKLAPDAAKFAGAMLMFRYASTSDALNRPTAVYAIEPDGSRKQLLADVLVAGL